MIEPAVGKARYNHNFIIDTILHQLESDFRNGCNLFLLFLFSQCFSREVTIDLERNVSFMFNVSYAHLGRERADSTSHSVFWTLDFALLFSEDGGNVCAHIV